MGKEGRSYASDYYKRHREEITDRKRERYHTDPEYRSKVKEYKRRMARKRRLLEGGKQDPINQPKGVKMLLVVNDEKHITEMFTVTQLCQRSGIRRPTLHSWEQQGWIPRPSYVNTRGHMVYTEYEFWGIHKAIIKRRLQLGQKSLNFRADKEFKAMIAKVYENLEKGLPKEFFEKSENTEEGSDEREED